MKQVIQNLRTGVLELIEVPCPQVSPGHLLIQTRASLISAGTERSLVEFGQASLLAKARQQPDRVRQVLDKIKADGLLPTLEAVFSRLDEPLPLGYCNAGVVVEVGQGVSGFEVGDRIASNGAHAQYVSVPTSLCARIAESVSDDSASFAVLGAISLQGVRLLQPGLGESVAVFGLGLVGLLAVQMLVASGVRVLGIDLDPARLALAKQLGATPVDVHAGADSTRAAMAFTQGNGVDGVLIAANASGDTIINQSARMCRKRGRIVLVGVVDTQLNRAEFYQKELTFQVSCSYGPGRYDAAYEQQGHDYPYGFVRWTEQRNIQAVLDMLTVGRLDVEPLITSRIPFGKAQHAYQLLTQDRKQLGIVLQYETQAATKRRVIARSTPTAEATGHGLVVAGIIGAGGFTRRMLLPSLKKTGAVLHTIASASGITAADAARKFDISQSTSDYRTILDNEDVNTVFITTRHNLHAPLVADALRAGKHVFVEKPLAIDLDGLEHVQQAYAECQGQHLMVGFNRRFAPHSQKIRQLLTTRSAPVCMTMLVNAGAVPPDHWTQDAEIGGGRLVGEGCHWIDLMSFLADSPVKDVVAVQAHLPDVSRRRDDLASVSLQFEDGSIGTLHYFANGHRKYPKEELTVFCDGAILVLDNFRRLTGYGWPGFRRLSLIKQDKGHQQQFVDFVQRAAEGGPPLISAEEIWNVTSASFL